MRFVRRSVAAFAATATLIGLVSPVAEAQPTSSGATVVEQGTWDALPAGKDWYSPNRTTRLDWQTDGNLVVYVDGRAKWASWTDKRGYFLANQEDGNLVVYTYNGEFQPIFESHTNGYPTAELVVQDDGNVVMYWNRNAIWHTNTYRR